MGSAWESDLDFLKNSKLNNDLNHQDVLMLVVPHILGEKWAQAIRERGLEVFEINQDWDGVLPEDARKKIILINLKGVLCELYSHMGHAYVGGGYERSVHSVMEPFVAGTKIICGPKVHRSTEVEAIISVAPMALKVIPDQTTLIFAYSDTVQTPPDLTLRQEWLDNQAKLLESNLKEVLRLC